MEIDGDANGQLLSISSRVWRFRAVLSLELKNVPVDGGARGGGALLMEAWDGAHTADATKS